MENSNLLSLIIFAPLAGAVINWLVGRRVRNERFIGIVACASVGLATVIAFFLAFKPDGALQTTQPIMDHLWTWIQVGSFRADFGLAMDRLSGIYALFVTLVGFLIHIFATGYMHGDRGYYRFFAYLNLFMFAMLTLVLADNFLLMFVGWEGVGLCSYLLIGFYLDRDEAAPAAKKAFIANRVGDWGFILGVMLIFFLTSAAGHGSISFFDKPAQGVTSCSAIYTHAPAAMFIVAIIGAATALFAATIGIAQNDIKKVLAYSTISQLGYMFLACGVGAFVPAIFHVMTHAFFKAQLFLGSGSVIHGMHDEQDMRRMGGLRKYLPITWLTMCAGWLAICGVPIFAGFFSKDQILWKAWVAGPFSLPNPLFAKALWFVGALTALLTAIYMTRLMVLTFWGTERFDVPQTDSLRQDDHYESQVNNLHHHERHTPHESPWSMTVPLVVLAVLSTVGGLVGVPYAISSMTGGHPENYFEQTLSPVVSPVPSNSETGEGSTNELTWLSPKPQSIDGRPAVAPVGESPNAATGGETPGPEEVSQERLFALISIAIAVAGIGIGWFMFNSQPLRQMPRLLEDKYYIDEIYNSAIIDPIEETSREGLWKIFDLGVIDGIVNGLGRVVTYFARVVRYLQIGFVRGYAAIILAGALIIIGYFAYSGANVLRFLVR